jgi:periplasmic mercuric ion binding protein
MTRLLATALILLALGLGDLAAAERMLRLAVDNMTCATCPIIVRKSLEAVPGVAAVQVSLDEKTALVTFDDAETTVAALIEATTEAGFPSRPTE